MRLRKSACGQRNLSSGTALKSGPRAFKQGIRGFESSHRVRGGKLDSLDQAEELGCAPLVVPVGRER